MVTWCGVWRNERWCHKTPITSPHEPVRPPDRSRACAHTPTTHQGTSLARAAGNIPRSSTQQHSASRGRLDRRRSVPGIVGDMHRIDMGATGERERPGKGCWRGFWKEYDEAPDSPRHGSSGVIFALPNPPHLLLPPMARPIKRYAPQWHVAPTSNARKQPYALSERAFGLALSPRCAHNDMCTELNSGVARWMNHDNERVAAPEFSSARCVFCYGPRLGVV